MSGSSLSSYSPWQRAIVLSQAKRTARLRGEVWDELPAEMREKLILTGKLQTFRKIRCIKNLILKKELQEREKQLKIKLERERLAKAAGAKSRMAQGH